MGKVDTVEIAVGLDSWRPTYGTRVTGARNTYPRVIVRDGELTPVPNPPPSREWRFSQILKTQRVTCAPLTEIILLQRHLGADTITSYMNAKPLAELREPTTPPPEAVDSSGRSAQRFVVETQVRGAFGCALASATGQDIYAVTAPIVAEAVESVVRGDWTGAGVFAPSEVFQPRAFLERLKRDIRINVEVQPETIQ